MKDFFRSRTFILSVLALGIIAACFWFLRATPHIEPLSENPSPASASSTNLESSSQRLPLPPPTRAQSRKPHPADRPHIAADKVAPSQRQAAETDPQLTKVASSLRDYRLAFQQNPTGNNADITRILLGKNTRAIRYLPADIHLNEKNELLDRWGQPFFFHQISGTLMEVRSAGPDQIMWTADDEVLR